MENFLWFVIVFVCPFEYEVTNQDGDRIFCSQYVQYISEPFDSSGDCDRQRVLLKESIDSKAGSVASSLCVRKDVWDENHADIKVKEGKK